MSRALTTSAAAIGHAVGEKRVAHELDDQRAQQRADDGGAAAREQRAADGDRGDRVELHAEADQVGVAGGVDGDHDQAGDAAAAGR